MLLTCCCCCVVKNCKRSWRQSWSRSATCDWPRRVVCWIWRRNTANSLSISHSCRHCSRRLSMTCEMKLKRWVAIKAWFFIRILYRLLCYIIDLVSDSERDCDVAYRLGVLHNKRNRKFSVKWPFNLNWPISSRQLHNLGPLLNNSIWYVFSFGHCHISCQIIAYNNVSISVEYLKFKQENTELRERKRVLELELKKAKE